MSLPLLAVKITRAMMRQQRAANEPPTRQANGVRACGTGAQQMTTKESQRRGDKAVIKLYFRPPARREAPLRFAQSFVRGNKSTEEEDTSARSVKIIEQGLSFAADFILVLSTCQLTTPGIGSLHKTSAGREAAPKRPPVGRRSAWRRHHSLMR